MNTIQSRVPTEMLARIFWMAATQCFFAPPSMRLVCRRWNQIAANSPDLWTNIFLPPMVKSIKDVEFDVYLRYIAVRIQRSETRRLFVRLDLTGLTRRQAVMVLIALEPAAARIYSLDLRFKWIEFLNLVPRYLGKHFRTATQHVTFRYARSGSTFPIPASVLFGTMTGITHLAVHDLSLGPLTDVSLPQLRSLRCMSRIEPFKLPFGNNFTSFRNLLQFLSTAQELRELHFINPAVAIDDAMLLPGVDRHQDKICLKQLSQLVFDHVEHHFMRLVFEYIDTPALDKLSLHYSRYDLADVWWFSACKDLTIRSLVVEHYEVLPRDGLPAFLRMLIAMPHLKTLSIICQNSRPYRGTAFFKMLKDRTDIVPNLADIHLKRVSFFRGEELLSLVDARQGRVEQLEINDCCYFESAFLPALKSRVPRVDYIKTSVEDD